MEKSFTMKKSIKDVVQIWLEKGDHDFKAAEILLNSKDIVADVICYHCHQAIEKYLKGFLISKKASIPKSHDLDYLLKLCMKEEMNFHSIKEKIQTLIEYTSDVRYPADDVSYSLSDAKLSYQTAKAIMEFIKKYLGQFQ